MSKENSLFGRIASTIQSGFSRLRTVPELQPMINATEGLTSPEQAPTFTTREIASTYLGYMRLVREVIAFDEHDLTVLDLADEKIMDSSADHHPTREILATVGPDFRSEMLSFLLQHADLNSEVFTAALQDLESRMATGSKLRAEGEDMSDTSPNPLVKHAIYSHTKKGIQDPAQIHVILTHGMARALSAQLAKEKDPARQTLAEKKDFFHQLLADAMMLKRAKAELGIPNHKGGTTSLTDTEKDIITRWIKAPPEGGMGWATEDRYRAVREKVAQVYRT